MGDKGRKAHEKNRKQRSVKKDDKVQKARTKMEKKPGDAPLGWSKRKPS